MEAMMNKEEYMNSLRNRLRRLPKEDLEKTLDYFEEYFAEAGPGMEAKAIEDLGSPESAAEQIIQNIALANAEEPVKDVKKGINAVWVGILALFAAPVALPMALVILAAILVIFILILVFILIILCSFFAGGCVVIAGPLSIAASFTLLFSDFPAFLSTLGIGLTCAGSGILILLGMTHFTKWLLKRFIDFVGHILRKGGKKA